VTRVASRRFARSGVVDMHLAQEMASK
jgi:hypothetical protein